MSTAVPRNAELHRRLAATPSPFDLLAATVREVPQRTALECLPDDLAGAPQALSYRQLLLDVQRFAAALRATGIRQEEAVAILLPFVPQAVVALLAASAVAVAFPVNLLLSAEAIRTQLGWRAAASSSAWARIRRWTYGSGSARRSPRWPGRRCWSRYHWPERRPARCAGTLSSLVPPAAWTRPARPSASARWSTPAAAPGSRAWRACRCATWPARRSWPAPASASGPRSGCSAACHCSTSAAPSTPCWPHWRWAPPWSSRPRWECATRPWSGRSGRSSRATGSPCWRPCRPRSPRSATARSRMPTSASCGR